MRPQLLPQPPRPQHGYIDVRIDLQVTRFSLNTKISIPCTVNSYSAPNVSWKFNGRPLSSSQRVQVHLQSLAKQTDFLKFSIQNRVKTGG